MSDREEPRLEIPESVLDATAKALYERDHGAYWRPDEKDIHMLDAEETAKAAIRAALVEWGATVEKRGKMFPAKREGFREYRDTEERITTRWLPVSSAVEGEG